MGKIFDKSSEGCLSAFCDATLRSQEVWTTEHFLRQLRYWLKLDFREISEEDLLQPDFLARVTAYLEYQLKQSKKNDISLILQDVGVFQGKDLVADIRYGWDISSGYGQRIKKNEMPPLSYAFTVSHVEEYIKVSGRRYQKLYELLQDVSVSYLEKKFIRVWLENYYSPTAPALIPEVHRFSLAGEKCGSRSFFYHDKNNWGRKGRLDFLIYNSRKSEAMFIELDGADFHKTKEQQQVDALKRNICAESNIPLKVFTYEDVENRIDSVFNSLDSLLKSQ